MATIRAEADLFTVVVRIRTPSAEDRAQVLDTCRDFAWRSVATDAARTLGG